MTLTTGTKLGPYEIVGAIGAGGMGEVYRARDTKLGREVALKVLPEAFASDAQRMARFRREAQVLASLKLNFRLLCKQGVAGSIPATSTKFFLHAKDLAESSCSNVSVFRASGSFSARFSLRIESARICQAVCFTVVAFLPFPYSRS